MAELITIVGGAYSNSYVTLPEADLIASNFPWYDDWNTYSDDEKTQALIQAAFAMQQLPWDGTKCSPASDAGKTYDRWGNLLSTTQRRSFRQTPKAPSKSKALERHPHPIKSPITWGTPGSLMPVEVENTIRMGPTSRMSGAIVYDENDNPLTGNIESVTPVSFQRQIQLHQSRVRQPSRPKRHRFHIYLYRRCPPR